MNQNRQTSFRWMNGFKLGEKGHSSIETMEQLPDDVLLLIFRFERSSPSRTPSWNASARDLADPLRSVVAFSENPVKLVCKRFYKILFSALRDLGGPLPCVKRYM